MRPASSYLERWRLLGVMSATLVALTIWMAAMRGFEVDGVRLAIRFTARTSLLFFCLAFTASALVRLWPTAWSRWQLRNRRYLGLSFAVSHGLHAIAIGAFAIMSPSDFAAATTPASFIFGGVGYAFIAAMAATSFDRTATAIGPRTWRILHTTGIYYLWFQFMVSFGMRIPGMTSYALFLLPLVVAMAIRIAAAVRSRRAKTRAFAA